MTGIAFEPKGEYLMYGSIEATISYDNPTRLYIKKIPVETILRLGGIQSEFGKNPILIPKLEDITVIFHPKGSINVSGKLLIDFEKGNDEPRNRVLKPNWQMQ
jgi:hypothetical protein